VRSTRVRRIDAAAVCPPRSSQQGPRDLVTRAFVVFALVALSSCVDKTPPPLWPTPPPPTLAVPIGVVTAPETAAVQSGPGSAPAAASPVPAEPDPGGLGPWRPEPGR
jgi:hypothetical protein